MSLMNERLNPLQVLFMAYRSEYIVNVLTAGA